MSTTITSKLLNLLGSFLLGKPEELFGPQGRDQEEFLPAEMIPKDYYTEHADRKPAGKFEIHKPEIQLSRLAIDSYRLSRVVPVAKLAMALGLVVCACGYVSKSIKTSIDTSAALHKQVEALEEQTKAYCAQPFIKQLNPLPAQCR